MTDKNTGQESDDWHEHGVRDEVEEVEHLHAENLEVCKRAVAEDGERADGYSTQCNNDSRDYAVPVELVSDHRNDRLHEGDGRSDCREEN